MAMSIFDKLFKKEIKNTSQLRIHKAIDAIANGNDCFMQGEITVSYVQIPLKHKNLVEAIGAYRPATVTPYLFVSVKGNTETIIKISQDIGGINGYLATGLGILIGFSEDASEIRCVGLTSEHVTINT